MEADGIACAGGMAADDPRCTEQFKNSDVAALKVAPEAGYEVASWEMNGDTAGVRNLDFAVKSKVDVLKNDIPFKNVNENKTLGFLKNRAFLFA